MANEAGTPLDVAFEFEDALTNHLEIQQRWAKAQVDDPDGPRAVELRAERDRAWSRRIAARQALWGALSGGQNG